jgi:hypothetical protein
MKRLYLVIALTCSALIGAYIANLLISRSFSEEIQFIQAEKTDADLSSLKEIQGYLRAGCLVSARQQLDNKIDQDLMLLAEHVRFFPIGKYTKRVKDVDPDLYSVIRAHKTDLKKTYSVDKCDGESADSKGVGISN